MKRLLALVPLLVLAALAALFVFKSLNRDPQVKPDALVGRTLPSVSMSPLAGGPAVPLSATVQGPTVVNVFASWCIPCRAEAPQLMRMKAMGVRVVGVAYRDRPEATRAFLADGGDPFAVILNDPEGRAGIELGITGVPESFLVDADGRVIAKADGPLVDAAATDAFLAKGGLDRVNPF